MKVLNVYLETRDERRYLAMLLREDGCVLDRDTGIYYPPEIIPYWLKPGYEENLTSLMMAS